MHPIASRPAPRPRSRPSRAIFPALLLAAALATPSHAATINWINPLGGNFQDGFNWSTAITPPTFLDTAAFDLNSSYIVTFNNNPITSGLFIGGVGTTFTANGAARNYAVSGNVDIIANLTFTGPNAFSLVSGSLDLNSGSLTIGPGHSFFTGAVTAAFLANDTATLAVNGGTFGATGNTTLSSHGTANVIFSNGAVGEFTSITAGNPYNDRDTTFNVTSGADVSATGNLNFGIYPGTAGQVTTIAVSGAGSTFTQSGLTTLNLGASFNSAALLSVTDGGTFSTGTKTFAINNTGTLSLSAATFNANGNVVISSGTLLRSVDATFSLATGKTLTATQNATVAFTGSYSLPDASVFTLTFGADLSTTDFLDIGNGSIGELHLDGPGTTLSIGGTCFVGGSAGAGTLTLRNTASASISSILRVGSGAASTGLLSIQSGATLSASSITIGNGGTGTVTVTGAGSSLSQANGTTLQVGTAANSANLNVSSGATFTTGTAISIINSAGTVTVSNATFNLRGNLGISGGTSNAAAGTVNWTGPNATLNVLSAGTATFDSLHIGLNNPPGTTQTVNVQGTASHLSALTALSIRANGILNITSGASASTGTTPTLVDSGGTLTLNGGTLIANSLIRFENGPTLIITGTPGNWSGQLDLKNNAALFRTADATDKSAKRATLASQLLSGKNGGLWNGPGITSSTIPLDPAHFTLALADNANLHLPSFRGQGIDDSFLLLAYARFGDANLDQKVDAFDLNILAAHWQQPSGALWSAGDFTNDNKVDAFDLNLLAANWQSGVPLQSALAAAFYPLTSELLTSPSPIPEPASSCLLSVFAIALLAHTRRAPDTRTMA